MAGAERKGGLTPSSGREGGGGGGGGGWWRPGDSRKEGGKSGLGGGEEAVRISQSGLVRERILVRLGWRIELTGDRGDTLALGLLTSLHIILINNIDRGLQHPLTGY